MPPELQTRLLRVLSDGQFYRVGGHQPIKANVRVIAATHQDLEARVKQGLFREDLFHRLERDPPAAAARCASGARTFRCSAKHFLAKSARELGVEPKRLSDAALKYLIGAGLSRQRAPAREPVPLAHRDGARRQSIEVADLPPELRVRTQRARTTAELGRRAGARSRAALNRGEPGIMDELTPPVRERADRRRRSRTPAAGASRPRTCSASAAIRSRARSRNWGSTREKARIGKSRRFLQSAWFRIPASTAAAEKRCLVTTTIFSPSAPVPAGCARAVMPRAWARALPRPRSATSAALASTPAAFRKSCSRTRRTMARISGTRPAMAGMSLRPHSTGMPWSRTRIARSSV